MSDHEKERIENLNKVFSGKGHVGIGQIPYNVDLKTKEEFEKYSKIEDKYLTEVLNGRMWIYEVPIEFRTHEMYIYAWRHYRYIRENNINHMRDQKMIELTLLNDIIMWSSVNKKAEKAMRDTSDYIYSRIRSEKDPWKKRQLEEEQKIEKMKEEWREQGWTDEKPEEDVNEPDTDVLEDDNVPQYTVTVSSKKEAADMIRKCVRIGKRYIETIVISDEKDKKSGEFLLIFENEDEETKNKKEERRKIYEGGKDFFLMY